MENATRELLIRTLTAERDRIDQAIEELRSGDSSTNGTTRNELKVSTGIPAPTPTGSPKTKRTMSAARRKISDAMKRVHAERARVAARKK
jgi:hypothetical protein